MATRREDRSAGSAVSVRSIVLIEDDPGDALLVAEMLSDVAPATTLIRFASVQAALHAWPVDAECILLDLGLPDAFGLSALEQVRSQIADVAIVVLTGRIDDGIGREALAAGAQDFLVKDQVDGPGLERSVRYAVERSRAAGDRRDLLAAELRAQENARLARGLLPTPLIDEADLRLARFYRPGGDRVPLGGDFHDAVETESGVHLLIGDVCGHGPDEAALGVALRIAWRALVLAGQPGDAVVRGVERVLLAERGDDRFASIAMVSLDKAVQRATVYVCGHPAPLLICGSTVIELTGLRLPVLSFIGDRRIEPFEVELGDEWGLLLLTDGLFEGRRTPGSPDRLGMEGLADHLRSILDTGMPRAELVPALVAEAERRNGGPLTDDVAALLVGRSGWWC